MLGSKKRKQLPSTAKAHFSVEKIVGNLLALLAFTVMAAIGIRIIPTTPKVGWLATILFGTMSVLVIVEIVRICGLDQDQIPDVKEQLNIRRPLLKIGMGIVTIFFGLAENFLAESFSQSFPRLGVWFSTFVTTLAFYPFRHEKEEIPNFELWAVRCALLGVISVVISYLKDWLEALLS